MNTFIKVILSFIFGGVVAIVFYTSFFVVATDDRSTMNFQVLISTIATDMAKIEANNERAREELFIEGSSEYKNLSYVFRYANGDVVFSTNAGQVAILKINQSENGSRFITCIAAPENTTNCENFRKYID